MCGLLACDDRGGEGGGRGGEGGLKIRVWLDLSF